MKTILVYQSYSGFTKRYAEWIQEELNCTTVPLKEADISKVAEYDIVIFGGGIHASRINGVKFIRSNWETLKTKHLIMFATGATPAEVKEEVDKYREINVPSGSNIPFFYFQSGLNYKDMRVIDKILMGLAKFVLKTKKDKDSVEQGATATMFEPHDSSNPIFIKPLIDYVKGLG
ncbi:MAG: hypothetical protein GX971_05180 [Firmicutes bacterium]|nr:hypothetical protein [Bacillota bacterium]